MQLNALPIRKCQAYLMALVFMVCVPCALPSQVVPGQEAQALQDAPRQGEAHPMHRQVGKKTEHKGHPSIRTRQEPVSSNGSGTGHVLGLKRESAVGAASRGAFDQTIARHLAPQKPNRPIPVMLIVLGSLMILVWGGLLAGAILTTAVLAVVFLIAMIAFIPVMVLGVIFLLGGIVAGTSKSRKAKPEPEKGS